MEAKQDTLDNVTCTDCGKLFDAVQMTKFQKYELFSYDGGFGSVHQYWEEVIPGKKRKNPLSDKLPDEKVLCPPCATRYRYEIKRKEKMRQAVDIIIIIVGIFILAYLL